MSDERTRRDGEADSLLGELWSTPVGRRWVLKAGLGAAAAAAASRVWPAPAVAQAARRKRRRHEHVTLQFALGHLRGVSRLVLVANGTRYPLVRHTSRSRAALRAKRGLWAKMDLSVLSHHVERVLLPTDQSLVVTVFGKRRRREVLVAHLWHVPPRATRRFARVAHRHHRLRSTLPSRRRLHSLGLARSDISTPEHVVQLASIADVHTTAVGLVGVHPNVATKNPDLTGPTTTLLHKTTAVTSLGVAIEKMQKNGRDVATDVPVTNPDGSRSQITVCNPASTVVCKPTGFSTIKLNTGDPLLRDALKPAVKGGIRAVRDDGQLGAVIDKPLDQAPAASTKTWVQSQGVAPQPQLWNASSVRGVDINLKNPGNVDGTRVEVRPPGYANGRVPLRLYNNHVRWLWVYVQYLGSDDTNLTAQAHAGGYTPPDTKYSKSLGLLPQVFTVLGVPIWDTNTIDVELDFPEGAYKARLLFCGLGSNLEDGNWRQYFPPDAYPDKIAPTDEVLVPALLTGILTIGLTIFALYTDLAIAAVWTDLRRTFQQALANPNFVKGVAELDAVVNGGVVLASSETVAASTVAGDISYQQIKSGGLDIRNMWTIILGLAGVIPKVIFNPRATALWRQAAISIISAEAGNSALVTIPLFGEALGILEVAGDVATLAEVCAETIVDPWVIENEVTVTYQATVTVDHDPCAPSWPARARSWSLQAKLDGATALAPITGPMNAGGHTGSDPLGGKGGLTVTAPFGGQQIQWTAAVFDGPLDSNNQPTGSLVGSGVSGTYPNNDPSHTPSAVSFAIRQIQYPVVRGTVFERADTTTYSTSDGGYTWSDSVSDAGTLKNNGIDKVTGVTVATRLGVVGVVWRQDGKYWVRGVPIVENGNTIRLGPVTHEGYDKQPYLMFDSFVDTADCGTPPRGGGGHVLLEPDPVTEAYHVRRVDINAEDGALSWDSSVSYGMFPLDVSAAALHSSGQVVVAHTNFGRLGRLQPVAPLLTEQGPSRPPVGAYTAGKGTQVGLLKDPVAVAITHPGVVLVLEQGTSQVSAFDLNGNPVPYFLPNGPSSRGVRGRRRGVGAAGLQYTLPLASPGTPLDLAVDGSGQIYVLYFTSAGLDPQNYRIDVYTQQGQLFASQSTGVNVPRLAVDFWRSVYAANYDPLVDEGTTTPHIDSALKVKEPSISRFDPHNPPARRRTIRSRLTATKR